MRGLLATCLLVGLMATNCQAIPLNWCVTSFDEMTQCNNMASDLVNTYTNVGLEVTCIQESNKYACMRLAKDRDMEVWVMRLSGEDAFVAGRYHGLHPLVKEIYQNGARDFSVAVIKHPEKGGGTIMKIADLRGKKSCHPDIDHIAGWSIPYARLVGSQMQSVGDCDAALNNTATFFTQSCAPGSWALDQTYKNSLPNMCELCKENCGRRDTYATFQGAVDCLKSAGADAVAFTTYSAARKSLANELPQYGLLCTKPNPLNNNKEYQAIGQPLQCNWGEIPGHMIMIRGSVPDIDKNEIAQRLALVYDAMPTGLGKPLWFTSFFLSPLSDESNPIIRIAPIDPTDRNDYKKWLDDEFRWAMNLDEITGLSGPCTGQNIGREYGLCVISKPEREKCEELRDAMISKRIRPILKCVEALDYKTCVGQVSRGASDLVNLNAGWIYYAGTTNDITNHLIPLAREEFADEPRNGYYAVAVMKTADVSQKHLNLWNIGRRGFKSCHAYEFEGASWIVASQRLMDLNQWHVYHCDVADGLKVFMNGGSCVPGATRETAQLCRACASGEGSANCKVSQEDNYFGHVGAFRCLAEGAGDIAFTKHTVPLQNTNGKNLDAWAKDLTSGDFTLLCADRTGSFAPVDQGSQCNLNWVPSNHIMISNRMGSHDRIKLWRMLESAQRFFGSQAYLTQNDGQYNQAAFHMFDSNWLLKDKVTDLPRNYSDLIFTDTSHELKAVPWNNTYQDILQPLTGNPQYSFLKLARQSDYGKTNCWRRSAAPRPSFHHFLYLTLAFLILLQRRTTLLT